MSGCVCTILNKGIREGPIEEVTSDQDLESETQAQRPKQEGTNVKSWRPCKWEQCIWGAGSKESELMALRPGRSLLGEWWLDSERAEPLQSSEWSSSDSSCEL